MDGAPVGLDLAACLRLAEAKGYDIGIIADLLPAAEEGLLEGVAKVKGGDG